MPGWSQWETKFADPKVWHFRFHMKRDLPEMAVRERERSRRLMRPPESGTLPGKIVGRRLAAANSATRPRWDIGAGTSNINGASKRPGEPGPQQTEDADPIDVRRI